MECSYCGGTETFKDVPRCWGCGAYKPVTKSVYLPIKTKLDEHSTFLHKKLDENEASLSYLSKEICKHSQGFHKHKDIYGCMIYICPECGVGSDTIAIPTRGM